MRTAPWLPALLTHSSFLSPHGQGATSLGQLWPCLPVLLSSVPRSGGVGAVGPLQTPAPV